MKNNKVFLPLLLVAVLLFTMVGGVSNFSYAYHGHAAKFAEKWDNGLIHGNKWGNKTGQLHYLQPGDKLVYNVIPAGQEQPIGVYYYEEITDRTYVTPDGVEVKINSIGNVGEAPHVYLAFTQNEDRDLKLYGMLIPHPADPSAYALEAWVTNPESGHALIYPGTYYIGLEWTTAYEILDPMGNIIAAEDLTYTVETMEHVTTKLGKFKTFKVVARDRNGEINSITWFEPELGINVKKISYSPMGNGFELSEYDFVSE